MTTDPGQERGASPQASTGLSPTVEPTSCLAGSAASIPSADITVEQDRDRWQRFALALNDELKRRTFIVSGLLSVIKADRRGFADGVLINAAEAMLGELSPESRAEAEYSYKSWCLADPDHVADGTRGSLAQTADMIATWGPECWPANEHGQVDFARAMMDSAADEIRAFLRATES